MRIIFFLLLQLSTFAALAQHKLSPAALQRLEVEKSARNATDEKVAAYIHLNESCDAEALRETLAAEGIEINTSAAHIFTARIPLAKLRFVSEVEDVKYVAVAEPVRPQLDLARIATGVDRLHQADNLPAAYTGKGVVVGIVDAGFDYRHPAFRAADGTLRIKRVWEQGWDKGTPPEGFTYGGELNTPETILNAHGDVTTNSHGTHVAAMAAGASAGTAWQGVATEADIVLVSKGNLLTDGNVNISDAVAYIYKYAESVGKPCVINLSLGTTIGPHDGTSAFDLMADALQGEGRLLVGSAGNFGSDKVHVTASEKDVTLKTVIDSKAGFSSSNTQGTIDVWSEKAAPFEIQVAVVNKSSGEAVIASEAMNAAADGATQTFELTKSASGSVMITTEVNPVNGRTHALVSLNVKSVRFNHELVLFVTPRSEAAVHAWADNVYVQLTDEEIPGYTAGNAEYSIAEIGGTGKRILSVGAYTTRNKYTTAGTTTERETGESLSDIASFSSKGPTLDGRIKPGISAPGTFIISAVSGNDVNLSSLPLAGSVDYEGRSYLYGFMQGTSMAAPFVAGIAATWLQANPALTPEQLTEIATTTALTDSFTGELPTVGSPIWGNGKVDAYAGLKKVLSTTGITSPVLPTTTSDAVFDLSGRRVSRPSKGIYITGGRKVIF